MVNLVTSGDDYTGDPPSQPTIDNTESKEDQALPSAKDNKKVGQASPNSARASQVDMLPQPEAVDNDMIGKIEKNKNTINLPVTGRLALGQNLDFEKKRKRSPRKNRSPEPLDMYLNSKSIVTSSGYTTGA